MSCWDKKTKQRPATAHCYGLIQIFTFPNYFHSTQTTIQKKTSYDKEIHVGNILTFLLFVGEAKLVARMDRKSTDANCTLDSMLSINANNVDFRFSPFTRLHHLRIDKRFQRMSPKDLHHLSFCQESGRRAERNQFLLQVERSSLFEHQRWTGSHSWRSELGRYDATQAVLL